MYLFDIRINKKYSPCYPLRDCYFDVRDALPINLEANQAFRGGRAFPCLTLQAK